MTKNEFAQWAENTILYLDGATGSNLMKAGMPSGVCPEKWILEHADVLVNLQKAYVAAGSNILYAPTFTANRIKLAEYGLENDIAAFNERLTALSRQAAGDGVYVAGDITMTGRQLVPTGTLELEELIFVYKEQITLLVKAGVDLLAVETMMSLQEARAALIAARETCDLPVMVTLTFEKDGRTLFGTDAVSAAVTLSALGADALGVNCSAGPDVLVDIIKQMSEVTAVPIIAKPNAGLPFLDSNGNTCYDMSSDDFAQAMLPLMEAGASILGGCCGTTPEYIRKLKSTAGTMRVNRPLNGKQNGLRYLCSERKTLAFGLEDAFIIIGERINPTGKKKLQAELKGGSLDMILQFAEEQEAAGAQILDLNMGMGGIDEQNTMIKAIQAVTLATPLPLSIDSSHIEVIEAALRNYPGRALINSISFEQSKCRALLTLAQKYGAMFILLPLSDAGLPANIEEKKAIIDGVCSMAEELGLQKKDIVVDALVNTVGANKEAALQALETIRYCKSNQLATVCGLSNISFGLPERSFVNTAFLTMAISQGLTMAIANPCQEALAAGVLAADLLLNREDADMRYISCASAIIERRKAEEANSPDRKQPSQLESQLAPVPAQRNHPTAPPKEVSLRAQLKEAVLKGNQKGIATLTSLALQNGEPARDLLDTVLLPAINEVGDLFDKGKYFLPQLIAGAEAMKLAIEVLEPHLLTGNASDNMPVIVIATVEGDIHDIGKNLVALMLKNYGFQVIDLGKDVSKERIIEAAREHHAQIIALSALMTTTMKQMKEVIAYARESGVTAQVIVGGAVITQDYADEIGADGYSGDAAEAVKLARRLLGMMNR